MARSNMGFVRRVDRVPLQRQRIARELFTPRRIRAQQGSATGKAMGAVAVGAVGAGIGEYLFAYREVNGATQLERVGSHISTLDRVVPATMGFVALEVPFLIALGIARLARGGRRTAEQVRKVTGLDVVGERVLTVAPPARTSGSLPAIMQRRSDPKAVAVSLALNGGSPGSASVSIPIDMSGGAQVKGLKEGDTINIVADSYKIVRRLGAGGMGKVWQAEKVGTGEKLAIKELLLDNPDARSRFWREAGAIRDFSQRPRKKGGEWEPLDGVVGYKGFTEVSGTDTCYLFMEFLDGLPLYEFVQSLEQAYAQRTGLTTEQRIRELQLIKHVLFLELTQTLGAVYDLAKILHRDLKGDNVFVVRDAQGRPHIKILDWGLAKDLTENITEAGKKGLTEAEGGGILGTPSHMAPETIWAAMRTPDGEEFDRRAISIQADMYSVGVMHYFALVGRRPFETDNFYKLHLSPQEPQLVIPDFIRPRTAEVLRRLLARHPNSRPRDYTELEGLMKAAISEISGQI